jgi:hypothetical protein
MIVGDPAEQISKLAREVDADLIITGNNEPTVSGTLI